MNAEKCRIGTIYISLSNQKQAGIATKSIIGMESSPEANRGLIFKKSTIMGLAITMITSESLLMLMGKK